MTSALKADDQILYETGDLRKRSPVCFITPFWLDKEDYYRSGFVSSKVHSVKSTNKVNHKMDPHYDPKGVGDHE